MRVDGENDSKTFPVDATFFENENGSCVFKTKT